MLDVCTIEFIHNVCASHIENDSYKNFRLVLENRATRFTMCNVCNAPMHTTLKVNGVFFQLIYDLTPQYHAMYTRNAAKAIKVRVLLLLARIFI